jgi:hypothetical protein
MAANPEHTMRLIPPARAYEQSQSAAVRTLRHPLAALISEDAEVCNAPIQVLGLAALLSADVVF